VAVKPEISESLVPIVLLFGTLAVAGHVPFHGLLEMLAIGVPVTDELAVRLIGTLFPLRSLL
jgi:hypothetical protein